MTKRRYRFGDAYIVNQIRLRRHFIVLYETGEVGIHVPHCQPLLAHRNEQ